MAELPKDMIYHFYSDDGITIKLDATELVRCRDCKYSRPYRMDKYTCEKEHDCGDYTVHADWFCADGKRRGEEDETY